MRESELLLKQVAKELDVPVADVPKVVKNLLKDIAGFDALIEQLTR